MLLPLDAQVIVALVALVNAVSAGTALIITALGHAKTASGRSKQKRKGTIGPSAPPTI